MCYGVSCWYRAALVYLIIHVLNMRTRFAWHTKSSNIDSLLSSPGQWSWTLVFEGGVQKVVVLLSWLNADILVIHDRELILGLLWYLTHLLISLFDLWSHLSNFLECYLISSELLPKYRNLHFERFKCVGVTVDNREANNILKIKQLLQWFSNIGIKYVVLYEIEGVIMKIFLNMLTCLNT